MRNHFLLLMLLAGTVLAPGTIAPAAPLVLQIASDVRVCEGSVILEDLVVNRAELPPDWTKRTVCEGPSRPGLPRIYTLVSLATALQQYPDMLEVTLRGAPQIRVLRQSRRPTDAQLTASLERFMDSNQPWKEGGFTSAPESGADLPGMPEGATDVSILRLQGVGSVGRLAATACYIGGAQTNQFSFPVRVTRRQVVWTAASDLQRGRVIEPGDVVASPLTTDGRVAFVPADEPVVGMELVNDARAGQPLAQSTIRQPVCSEKGSAVTIASRTGGIVVTVRAKALSRGRRGDTIMCINESSKRQFQARLTGQNQGELPEL